MAAESFFDRWSKRNTETAAAAPDAAAEPVLDELTGQPRPHATEPIPAPTLEDVASLTPQSDYARFIGKGVDENIQRAALKKLFTDPHYNIMDGLDIYIGDYNKFEPIPPEMLALLNHAKGLLDPLSQFEKPLMRLMEEVVSTEPEPTPADAQAPTNQDTPDSACASAELHTLEPLETHTNPPLPDDDTPPQTLTKPDNDHKI